MTQEPTERELELARRLQALEDQATRPSIAGGGIVIDSVNAITRKVPPWIITWAIVAFLGFHAWQWTNEALQLRAETEKLQAQAAKAAAKLMAIRQDGGDGETLALENLRADIAKAEAARDNARAEANAKGQDIGGVTARVAEMKAAIRKAEAEAAKTRATIEAYSQRTLDGIPVVIAQKKADVETAEAQANTALGEATQQLQSYMMMLRTARNPQFQRGEDMFRRLEGR